MSEMIERVARALAECDGCEDWDRLPEDSYRIGAQTKSEFRERARAAIEAMREPTEAMLGTSHSVTVDHGSYAEVMPHNIQENWQTMIDAALK